MRPKAMQQPSTRHRARVQRRAVGAPELELAHTHRLVGLAFSED